MRRQTDIKYIVVCIILKIQIPGAGGVHAVSMCAHTGLVHILSVNIGCVGSYRLSLF